MASISAARASRRARTNAATVSRHARIAQLCANLPKSCSHMPRTSSSCSHCAVCYSVSSIAQCEKEHTWYGHTHGYATITSQEGVADGASRVLGDVAPALRKPRLSGLTDPRSGGRPPRSSLGPRRSGHLPTEGTATRRGVPPFERIATRRGTPPFEGTAKRCGVLPTEGSATRAPRWQVRPDR